MAPDMTGFCVICTVDIPVPRNVHRYYLPGTSHGGGIRQAALTGRSPSHHPVIQQPTYPSNPNGENYTNNALQADFIDFLMNGTPMPPSNPGVTYPTLPIDNWCRQLRRPRDFRTSLVSRLEGIWRGARLSITSDLK